MSAIYKRGDGVAHEDERRLSFGAFLDHLLPLVGIGLLGWLCLATMNLQQQVAVLVERTGVQNSRMEQQARDILALRASDADLQRQIEAIHTGARR